MLISLISRYGRMYSSFSRSRLGLFRCIAIPDSVFRGSIVRGPIVRGSVVRGPVVLCSVVLCSVVLCFIVQRFRGSEVQSFRGSVVQRFSRSEFQLFRSSVVPRFCQLIEPPLLPLLTPKKGVNLYCCWQKRNDDMFK
jgi:hypothetical protein